MKKYVRGLEKKGLIFTEPTKVNTKDGRVHNGSLCYTILPIRDVVERHYEMQLEKARLESARAKALENGMDVKTLSATIGHVSAATTLDIYSHMTDTMQMQAAVSIDRKIGGTNAQMPAVEQTPTERANSPVNAPCAPTEPHPEPIPSQSRANPEKDT